MTEPVRSVLHDVQVAQGATFRDDDGWLWTMGFGNPDEGYAALRDGAALWDVYPLVKWDVTGPQAAEAVQRVFTGDVVGQQAGQVRYGAFTDEDGLLVDDGTVFKHDDEHFWVLTNTSGFGDHWATHTQGLDFSFENRVHEMPLLSLQGPGSRDLVQALADRDLPQLGYFRFGGERVTVGGVQTWLMRTGFSGELGFEMIPDRDDAETLWGALADAGAVPIGLDTVEPARIEAGLIIYGTDYTPGVHTPYDVSLDRNVALGSGADFVGRARLAEIAAAPPHRLKTLVLDGVISDGGLPDAGAVVLDGGEPVGVMSSRTRSPRHGAIGLAMLDTPSAVDGRPLEVLVRGGSAATVAATVAPLSVKDPEKRRPRG